MNSVPKGLILDFFRPARGVDCSLGGISARFDRCVLIGVVDYGTARHWNIPARPVPLDSSSRVFTPGGDYPAVYLAIGKHSDHDRFIIPADPETYEPDQRHGMFGGNFANTSDSRFSKLLPAGFAVRVHDRYER